MMARAASVWLVIMLLESVHGWLRRAIMPKDPGLLLSNLAVMIGCAIVVVTAFICRAWLSISTPSQAARVGAAWVALTLAFEIGLARMIGAPWSQIASEYDLSQGRLMGFGLLVMGLAPWLTRPRQRL